MIKDSRNEQKKSLARLRQGAAALWTGRPNDIAKERVKIGLAP